MQKYLLDVAERALSTYAQALLALVAVDAFDWYSVDAWKGAALAALPAALSVVKSALAALVGDSDSAALLPKARE